MPSSKFCFISVHYVFFSTLPCNPLIGKGGRFFPQCEIRWKKECGISSWWRSQWICGLVSISVQMSWDSDLRTNMSAYSSLSVLPLPAFIDFPASRSEIFSLNVEKETQTLELLLHFPLVLNRSRFIDLSSMWHLKSILCSFYYG